MNRSEAISKIFLFFFASQLVSVLFVFLHPASAKTGNLVFLYVVNVSFILSMIVPSLSILFFLGISKAQLNFGLTPRKLSLSVVFAAVLVFVGFLLISYDRVVLRGIDYTEGLRAARYAWMASGPSSWYGVLGNLLAPISFFSLIVFVIFFEKLGFILKIISVSSVGIGVIGVSALNGGRSIVLLAIIFTVICLCARPRGVGRKSNGFKLMVVIIIVASVLYASKIVESSASLGEGVSLEHLTNLGVNSLYGEFGEHFDCAAIKCLSVYISAYLFHGQWTTQVMGELAVRPGSYALYPLSTFLMRLGFVESPLMPGSFSESGAFVSFPGALFYDFGFYGVVLGGFIFGVFLGACLTVLARSRSIGIAKLMMIFYFLSILFLSPVVPAYGFVYLNILILSNIFYGCILFFLFKGDFKIYDSSLLSFAVRSRI